MKVTTIRNLIFMTVILAVSVAFTPAQTTATGCGLASTCCQMIQNGCKCAGGTPVGVVCSSSPRGITCLNVPFTQGSYFENACLYCGGLYASVLGEPVCVDFDP